MCVVRVSVSILRVKKPRRPSDCHTAGEGYIQEFDLLLLTPKFKLSTTLTGLSFGSLSSAGQAEAIWLMLAFLSLQRLHEGPLSLKFLCLCTMQILGLQEKCYHQKHQKTTLVKTQIFSMGTVVPKLCCTMESLGNTYNRSVHVATRHREAECPEGVDMCRHQEVLRTPAIPACGQIWEPLT